MPTNLNLEKGTFSEYFHVPFKHVKKYTFLDWTFEWGPSLTYFQSFQKYLEQYLPSIRVTKTLLQRTLELNNTYELEECWNKLENNVQNLYISNFRIGIPNCFISNLKLVPQNSNLKSSWSTRLKRLSVSKAAQKCSRLQWF